MPRLKSAIRSGEISIEAMYSMTSKQRQELFESYLGAELAQKVVAGFERAMVSKQQKALVNWASSVFSKTQKNEETYKAVNDKIKELEQVGALGPDSEPYLESMVADSLGISLSASEVKEISTRAEELEKLYNSTEGGIPSKEYFVRLSEMEKYIRSLAPASSLKVATSVAGRGAMLFSLKSPLTNIISNTVNGIVQAMERRISSNTYRGLNGSAAVEYVKRVQDIYQASGYDISRMEALQDEQARLGEEMVHSEGQGAVRRIGRLYEDVVFKQLMGAPDVAYSAAAFADSADLASTQIALKEGLKNDEAKKRAKEIFDDAIRIRPLTAEGEMVRSQGIADAQYATYTNKGGYADLAMAIRTALNKATGDIRLGDQLMPFVKTPANVVQAAVDSAGVGMVRAAFKLRSAVAELKSGNGEPMRDVVRLFIRSGLGMSLSVMLAFILDPEDFVGEYDALSQKDRDIAKEKGAPYNSIKIGDKYISLDYFGPLGAAFVGIMYARKYGDTLPEKILQYGQGVAGQVTKVPGLKEFTDLVDGITEATKRGTAAKTAEGLAAEAIDYIRARVIPALLSDLSRATDPFERKAEGPVDRIKSTIPGLRQELPPKISQTTGEPVPAEGFISTMLFGSRVQTSLENKVVTEISRLSDAGVGPTISDIERSSSRVQELRAQIGDEKFEEAIAFYGKEYGRRATKVIGGFQYKQWGDEKKRDKINDARSDALEATLRRYHYRKPKNP